MNIINDKTVSITSSKELKDILENDNNYNYIYLENDITLESGISINRNKTNITINGTYQNVTHTLTGLESNDDSDTITCTSNTKEIKIKNIVIKSVNLYGFIYIPLNISTDENIIIFDNITFNGTNLASNPYGTIKINNCNINITTTNDFDAQEVCSVANLIIGGKTNISNSSIDFPLFTFNEGVTNPSVIFLCKSEVILSSINKEFMSGTNKLNFTILHDTSVHLTTANGFAYSSNDGANNILIDERASFIFIEKSYQTSPLWTIMGSLNIKKDSDVQIINSSSTGASDNFNMHFKGSEANLAIDDVKNLLLYSQTSNVIHVDNLLNFNLKCKRINMWPTAKTLSEAGDINNLPDYFWYKEHDLIKITGIIMTTLTSITTNNITAEEAKKTTDIGNFTFQNKKQLSIGTVYMNIHPINATKSTISGHTKAFADILIKYNTSTEIINADDNGFFEYNLPASITNDTTVELTANVSGSFLYGKRTITTPFTGELTLLDGSQTIDFSLTPFGQSFIYPKTKEIKLTIVDSREISSNWKLYAYINKDLTSTTGNSLKNAIVFQKLDNVMVTLTTTPTVIHTGTDNANKVNYQELTYSKEKGPLLNLSNKYLEINEEYFAEVYFYIEP